LQKLIFKGPLKDDDKTLSELGLQNESKLMLVGSKVDEVVKVTAAAERKPEPSEDTTKKEDENIFDQQPHKKIIEQGLPADAMPAIPGHHEALPGVGITGLLNKLGSRIRLSVKSANDEILIATQSSTQKIPFASVSDIIWRPIPGNPNYLVMQMKMGGGDDANSYFIYWVPIQYKRTLSVTILGYQ